MSRLARVLGGPPKPEPYMVRVGAGGLAVTSNTMTRGKATTTAAPTATVFNTGGSRQ